VQKLNYYVNEANVSRDPGSSHCGEHEFSHAVSFSYLALQNR